MRSRHRAAVHAEDRADQHPAGSVGPDIEADVSAFAKQSPNPFLGGGFPCSSRKAPRKPPQAFFPPADKHGEGSLLA